MTVCVAAICDSGKAIVVAADRMFTNPGLSVEFETDEQKIEKLTDKCVALMAGNSAYATEVLELVRRVINGNSNQHFHVVAQIIREQYAAVRASKIHETVIFPVIGSDYSRYQALGVSLPMYLEKQPMMYQSMVMLSQQFNLGAEFLVAGMDDEGAHLSMVGNPGVITQLQKLGHAAIGSGGPHAMTKLSLSGQNRSRGMLETLADVYSAKKASEVAPGVGDATDIAVIDSTKGVWPCPASVIEELDKVHAAMTTIAKPNLDALRGKCDELRK